MWFDPVQLAVSEKSPAANFANSANVQPRLPNKSARLASLARLAAPPELKSEMQPAPHSTWWLVHYLDGASAEVWANPPATEAETLERRPDAVAAQPLHQAAQSPISACVTCVHVTGRGSCGEPVAAELAKVDGLIRYHDDGGKGCPAWLTTFPDDLEALIKAVATFNEYSADDYLLIDEMKRADPDGLRLVLETDPLRPFYSHMEKK